MRSEVDGAGYRTISGGGELVGTKGSGFSMARTNTGEYTIRFDKPFRSVPVVVANSEHPSDYHCRINSPTRESVKILQTNNAAGAVNGDIHFVARGLA